MYILYVFEAKIRFSKIFIPNLGKFLLSKYINSAWPYGKTRDDTRVEPEPEIPE